MIKLSTRGDYAIKTIIYLLKNKNHDIFKNYLIYGVIYG